MIAGYQLEVLARPRVAIERPDAHFDGAMGGGTGARHRFRDYTGALEERPPCRDENGTWLPRPDVAHHPPRAAIPRLSVELDERRGCRMRQASASGRQIMVLVDSFPALSETFVANEVRALRDAGVAFVSRP